MTKIETEEAPRVGYVSEADKRELEEYFRTTPPEEQEMPWTELVARALRREKPC